MSVGGRWVQIRWAHARAAAGVVAGQGAGLLVPLLLGLLLAGCAPQSGDNADGVAQGPARGGLYESLGGDGAEGFRRASPGREFVFPADHAAHPGFRNEWWYLTGNLQTDDGRRLGYQATFFRVGMTAEPAARESAWAVQDVWMAHVALSDAAAGEHRAAERFARGAMGLAGWERAPTRVWLEDWTLVMPAQGPWELAIETPEFGFALQLQAERPPVLQGDAGYSRKGAAPGNASYYYSIPRLRTEGTVTLNGQVQAVSGLSWLDREWSTSALSADQEGWDWFALQLDSGRDLMFYRLRRRDGTADVFSGGSLVTPARDDTAPPVVQRLQREDVLLQPLRWWEHDSGRRYPVAWRLQIPQQGVDWQVEAVFDDQFMAVSIPYWEGMVTVRDAAGALRGRGYLEMAGY